MAPGVFLFILVVVVVLAAVFGHIDRARKDRDERKKKESQ